MTPEERREHKRLVSARWRAALAEKPKEAAAYRARQSEAQRKRRAKRKAVQPGPLVGCVLWSSAPSTGRDLLQAITAATGKMDDRDEVIAQAALLVLEGATVTDAVKLATRAVRRDGHLLRYAKQIEVCDWI